MNDLSVLLGLWGKALIERGLQGGFYEKLLETSPMSDRVNASWLQDGSHITYIIYLRRGKEKKFFVNAPGREH